MVQRFGVVMESRADKRCPNHHALCEYIWGKVVNKYFKEALLHQLRLLRIFVETKCNPIDNVSEFQLVNDCKHS